MQSSETMRLPVNQIVHCDWGTKPEKCWMARARWEDNLYKVTAPEPVGDLVTFFARLRMGLGESDRLLVGFDFPIGLPSAYAKKAGVSDFVEILPQFGTGNWSRIYDKCRSPDEISLHRPFYPVCCKKKGDARKPHLSEHLGIPIECLLRECDRKTTFHNKACEMFWTLGRNQVGSAAIRGWRDLLASAIRCKTLSLGLWPFQGRLSELFGKYTTVVAETYPAEAYGHIGFPKMWKGKTDQTKRRKMSPVFHAWRAKRPAHFDDPTIEQIDDGFGSLKDGEDRFDAFVGLCSMIEITLGHRVEGSPHPDRLHIEGWILGQENGSLRRTANQAGEKS